jgi:predicted transposase/invertase (TIGR01784 family)
VTVISVLDFIYWKSRPAQWFSRYALQDEAGHRWTAGGLELVFIELPKVDSTLLPETHPLRDWLALLKNAPQWHNIPRRIKNPAVREAMTLASHDSLTPAEATKMTSRQLYKMDQINIRRYAREEGLAEGLAEGLEKGLKKGLATGQKKGRREALRQVAAMALSRGDTPEEVSHLTGLPLREVRALRPPAKPRRRKLQRA